VCAFYPADQRVREWHRAHRCPHAALIEFRSRRPQPFRCGRALRSAAGSRCGGNKPRPKDCRDDGRIGRREETVPTSQASLRAMTQVRKSARHVGLPGIWRSSFTSPSRSTSASRKLPAR
jgi:hypothetical protein